MRWRDFSLRKRLWLANLLMIVVPLCALLGLGSLLIGILHLADADHLGPLSLLWPERGPSLSIEYLVSDMRARADDHKRPTPGKQEALKQKFLEDCRLLEQQGVSLAMLRDGQLLYVTQGSDAARLQAETQRLFGQSRRAELWTEDVFAMRYVSPKSGLTIVALGKIPPRPPEASRGIPWKTVLEIVLGIVLLTLVAIILCLGRYLSQLLDKQVLAPLAELRAASAAIRQGNLEQPLQVKAKDEIGMACADFERMRQELSHARDERIRYENNRKELIAGISHDLRTPLTAVRGYVSALRDGIARTPEKKQHYLDMLYDSVLLLERLVNNLFLFSKLDLGKVDFQMEPVGMKAYLSEYLASVAAEREADCHLTVPEGLAGDMVCIDRLQFQRVLDNLLSNSRKYSQPQRAVIDIALREQGGGLEIAWQDHGCGVALQQLPRLFDSFYRTDAARSHVADGSGLGLAIVKEIVTGMKGRCSAEATPGGGLTIVLWLPLFREEEEKWKG